MKGIQKKGSKGYSWGQITFKTHFKETTKNELCSSAHLPCCPELLPALYDLKGTLK